MIEWIIALFLFAFAATGWFTAYRFYRKAVIYDEIFQFLYDDVAINIKQFAKMATSNVTQNEPEIVAAHRNMMIMGKRLTEIVLRMEDATGLRLRPPDRQPPPSVV